jgi:hypothetical protein
MTPDLDEEKKKQTQAIILFVIFIVFVTTSIGLMVYLDVQYAPETVSGQVVPHDAAEEHVGK